MARPPNYSMDRQDRERAKANKLAKKADKRERDRPQPASSADPDGPAPDEK